MPWAIQTGSAFNDGQSMRPIGRVAGSTTALPHPTLARRGIRHPADRIGLSSPAGAATIPTRTCPPWRHIPQLGSVSFRGKIQ